MEQPPGRSAGAVPGPGGRPRAATTPELQGPQVCPPDCTETIAALGNQELEIALHSPLSETAISKCPSASPTIQQCMEVSSFMCRKCRERSKLEMVLAHMRAQMEQVVEADMEALQVPSLLTPMCPQ